MKLSPNGVQLLQGFEGLSLTAYPDPRLPKVNGTWAPAQRWSVGYGHQLPATRQWEGYTITRAEADRLFAGDVASREVAVSLLTPKTTPQQFDAMVSLSYNIGIGDLERKRQGGFATSTVQRLHNAGDYAGAADAFRLWNKSAGAVDPVLVKRREKERGVYLNGYAPFGGSGEPRTPAASPTAAAGGSSSGAARVASAGAAAGFGVLALLLLFVMRGQR